MRALAMTSALVGATIVLLIDFPSSRAGGACSEHCPIPIQWTSPYEQQWRDQQYQRNREWLERKEQQDRNLQDQQNRLNQGRSGGSYGALAYSAKTGDYGYSYGFNSREQAEQRAKKECGQNDCEIAAWYSRACGAIAAG